MPAKDYDKSNHKKKIEVSIFVFEVDSKIVK